jgi:hypothetical protein
MSYVITSLGQLSDQLAVMILSGDTFEDPAFPGQNLESVFQDLLNGIENLKEKIGDAAAHRLAEAAIEARALYERAQGETANNILQHMREYIRLKKFNTDEEVVDESRFE